MSLSIIKSPYLISFTGNPVAFTFAITPYREAEQKKDYKIIVRVEVEEIFNSNSFSEVKEMQLYPEDNGCATISIQKILNSFLEQQLPRFTQDVIVPLTEQCKRYQLTYRLIDGTNLVQSPVTSSVFYALRGGLSYQEWNPKKFFTQKLAVDKTFLRFPVKKEFVFKDEYKFLSWVSSFDETNEQNLYVIIGYSDGTQSDQTLLKSVTVPAWQPCLTAAGWSQLNLDAVADATKTPVWYELQVGSGAVCIPVTVPAFTLPDAVQGVFYTYTIPFYGSATVSLGEISNPAFSWLTIAFDANSVTFHGFPSEDDVATAIPISFQLTNPCSGGYVTTNTTLNVLDSARATAWRKKASTAYCVNDGSGNITGNQAWTTLEEYYTDNNSLVIPSSEKSNAEADPDYVAPVENTVACPVGAGIGETTFVSGDELNDSEVANFTGIPGSTLVLKLDYYNNNNGGTLKVNGVTAALNNTYNVVLDGSGNGSLPVAIAGITNASTVILGHFTIISVSAGTIGYYKTYQISKVF